ncbi:MAG TPA: hypothetical protein VMH85_10125 [Terriglobales bacterium]|nr:hypothetical protein [Terriglobales bacterium]
MKQVMALALALAFATGALAAPAPQTAGTTSKKGVPKKKAHNTAAEELARRLDQMQQAIDSQQQQIQQLRQQVQTRDAVIQQLQQQSSQTEQKVDAASSQTTQQQENVVAVRHDVDDLKTNATNTAVALQESQQKLNGLAAVEGKLSDLAHGKVKIGATFYGDYSYYTDTGFGPQFLTQINQPGPGNGGFNSFDITRTYINLFYTPNDDVTLRLTPNIYRQVDVSAAQAFGKNAAIGSTSNGNLGFRLKYAYLDFNKLFSGSEALKKDKLTVGQTTNPLVDWEEGLYGYRYVNLTPWNYLSLSSTYTGVTLHGPIERNGKEYLDYHIGVFNTASFHAIEQNDKKQAMARLTWYPFGTVVDRTGFGITGFYDYGYNTHTPDTKSTPLYRVALLAHYQTHSKAYEVVGEYDLGRNAFGTGNLFSGSGPADEFGLGPTPYANFDALAKALLGGTSTRQQGFDFFGHARLGHSPFSLFGMYQYFQPNTKISGTNPLDFERVVGGLSYKYNDHFEFSVDDQNLTYAHSQFNMTADQIATFSSSLAAANPGGIPNAVPTSTNAIMLNLLFNY